MYSFVDYAGDDQLARLTQVYHELEVCHTRAAQASKNERITAKELRDVPEDQRRVPTVPIPSGGLSSFDADFTDPMHSGRSPKLTVRAMAHASALLEARAAWEGLYHAAEVADRLLRDYHGIYHELRDETDAPAWVMELFEHNIACLCQLLKESYATLAGFSDAVGINWHDECPLLSFDERQEVENFRRQWFNWFEALPELPPINTPDQRRTAQLLVQCMAARDDADAKLAAGEESDAVVRPHDHVSQASKEKVADLLHNRKWTVVTVDFVHGIAANFIRVFRPRNAHAPYVRPFNTARKRGFFSSRNGNG